MVRVRIWDLPTRVFHWLLALLVAFSWASGHFGGSDWREWHFVSGYALFALLLFRLAWGFVGPRYARFASFPLNPRAAWLDWRAAAAVGPGHGALGALSVYAMLAAIAIQVATGLFASDDSFSEGPWARLVSARTVDLLTRVHHFNRWLLLGLIVLHIGAIAYYGVVRRNGLVGAMVHGDRVDVPGAAADDSAKVRVLALALAVCAGIAAWLLTRG